MCSTCVSVISPEILSLLKKDYEEFVIMAEIPLKKDSNIFSRTVPSFQMPTVHPELSWIYLELRLMLDAHCKCVIYACISVRSCPRLFHLQPDAPV